MMANGVFGAATKSWSLLFRFCQRVDLSEPCHLIQLKGLLVVPELNSNLRSISRMCDEHYKFILRKFKCQLRFGIDTVTYGTIHNFLRFMFR